MMVVADLIAQLEQMDPTAVVLIDEREVRRNSTSAIRASRNDAQRPLTLRHSGNPPVAV